MGLLWVPPGLRRPLVGVGGTYIDGHRDTDGHHDSETVCDCPVLNELGKGSSSGCTGTHGLSDRSSPSLRSLAVLPHLPPSSSAVGLVSHDD